MEKDEKSTDINLNKIVAGNNNNNFTPKEMSALRSLLERFPKLEELISKIMKYFINTILFYL